MISGAGDSRALLSVARRRSRGRIFQGADPVDRVSTTSPSFNDRRGVINSPQPGGVPVRITSPGSSVKLSERNESSSAPRRSGSPSSRPARLAVHRGPQPLIAGRSELIGGHNPGPGAERVEALAPRPLTVTELDITGRDIVRHRIPEHVVEGGLDRRPSSVGRSPPRVRPPSRLARRRS